MNLNIAFRKHFHIFQGRINQKIAGVPTKIQLLEMKFIIVKSSINNHAIEQNHKQKQFLK